MKHDHLHLVGQASMRDQSRGGDGEERQHDQAVMRVWKPTRMARPPSNSSRPTTTAVTVGNGRPMLPN